MRNWHTKVIKLDKARNIIIQKKIDQQQNPDLNELENYEIYELGDPDLYVGVMEGSIEYTPIDSSLPIEGNNNYICPNNHLHNEFGDKKVIFRQRIDSSFYDENLPTDTTNKLPLTHTTSVAGVIAGNEIYNDNVSGICPDVKIINALGKFENSLILSGINKYTGLNIKSLYYQNEVIKDPEGKLISGSSYFDITEKKIPNSPKDANNTYSTKKSSIISCSFSWPNNPMDGTKVGYMSPEITDFVLKELFAYGRNGRGVLTIFAAGNENVSNPDRPFMLSNKTLIVAASKVTLDENKLDQYLAEINPLAYDEDHPSYSNRGDRIDICAPSCPVGKSAKEDLEIYSSTMMNSGEIAQEDQAFISSVLEKKSSTELILKDNFNGIFPGQSIEIGDPETFFHETRFITRVATVQMPVDKLNTNQNLRTLVTLDFPVLYTDELKTSTTNFTIVDAPVKICVFKKDATFINRNELRLDNMKGIGEFQSPKQQAYIYSGSDITNGVIININSPDYRNNTISLANPITLSSTTNLTLIPSQIFAKIKKINQQFYPVTGSSFGGFFGGQQVRINIDNNKFKRHLEFVDGTGAMAHLKFSQFSAAGQTEDDLTLNEYTMNSLAYGNLTNSFGGTSAATPITSGISALLLSVNPNLNAAEIKHILKITADKITGPSKYKTISDNKKYNYNYNTNVYFGTGRVNAEAAVQLALDWHKLPQPASVVKPKLKIADKLTNLGIWVKLSTDTTSQPTIAQPLSTVDTSKDHKIYVKIQNTGNRESFKECDLRVLVAFTDAPDPTFSFPDNWYNQDFVKLLSVKEIPIIPAGGEVTIEFAWNNIASFWETSNPRSNGSRKKAYLLAHIAPFDGLSNEVTTDNILNNKQLSCKKLIAIHNGMTDGSAYIPGKSLNITVGSAVAEKKFDLNMENVLASELEKVKIKATRKNRKDQTIEEIILQKSGTNWIVDNNNSDWITFDMPKEAESLDQGYKNVIFPHKLTINEDEDEIKLEIIKANA